jgi:small subunit ribosomal protein S6|tara:strand:+ start:3521 stop:3847 length:327 start_codon:yes stop_codon:yes gene_type:complete
MVSEEVATELGGGLRDYELTVIINPEITEDKLEARINSISQFVSERGGTVSEVQRWGKKRLAYPIKQSLEGIYALARFTLRPASGKELEADLRISEEVLRHLLIRLDS